MTQKNTTPKTQEVEEKEKESCVAILRRHVGSLARISEELGIRSNGVYQWAKGKQGSRRIAKAAYSRARKLANQERRAERAAAR